MRHTTIVAVVVLLGVVPATAAAQKTETFKGYAEWRQGNVLIVDGQRIRVDASTALKGAARDGLGAVELGWEVTAKGARLADGSVLARELEAKPNGTGAFEKTIAYEGRYDPAKAPHLWERFREKYGDNGKLMTFFFGSHPRESDRIAKMQEQVALNYAAQPRRAGTAPTTR